MTREKDFKKVVRLRMARTGESYAEARRQLLAKGPSGSLRGWSVTGPDGAKDYFGSIDPDVQHEGKTCVFVRSAVPEPNSHGVVMQSIASAAYHGKRVCFSAWVKCEAGTEDSGLWVRVVPMGRASTFARGAFKATTEWQHGAVVFDVDPRADHIMFGVSLRGPGHVWMSGVKFEEVDRSVPVTTEGALRQEPTEPVNLSFQG